MAKKNTVHIDVKVDDKGATKKVGVESKKAGKSMDGLGKSSRTADRNLKGAAQASSNGTKNFSKMAQGVGGLVGVYATLAAQAFALSAAFEFLKKVGDLRVLRDSQTAYASTTGIAIATLGREIRIAADGMLTFEEASKSAAIGLTSGLGTEQLTKLAQGAAAVSKVLGRDVSDSYDRLVRGVTKAEPELLDELGITLRLEDAKNKYAISIGKTVKQLSLLEAKQAVAVEVQSQLDTKFISTTDSIEIQGNAMKKFGIAFNDVFTSFAKLIAGPVEGAATFFAENIRSLIAVIGLFALTIIKSMMPSLDKFEAKMVLSADKAAASFERTKASYLSLKKATSASNQVKGALAGVDAKAGSGIANLKSGGDVTKRQAAALLKYAKLERGVYTQLTNHQKQVYKKALRDILGHKETFWQKTKRGWYGLGNVIEQQALRAKTKWKQAMAAMTRATTRASKIMGTAFKLMGYAGMAAMIFDLGKGILKGAGIITEPVRALTEFAAKVEATRDNIESLTTEYGKLASAIFDHLVKANEAVAAGADLTDAQFKPTIQSYKTLGNAVSTTANQLADLVEQQQKSLVLEAANGGLGNQGGGISLYTESVDFEETIEESKRSAKELARILQETLGIKAFKSITDGADGLADALNDILHGSNVAFSEIDPAKLRELAGEFELMSKGASAFEESFNNSNLEFDKFIIGIGEYKTKATDMLNTVMKEIQAHTANYKIGGQILANSLSAPKEVEALKNRLAFLTLINDTETKGKRDQLTLDREYALNMHGVTKLVQEQLTAQKKIGDLRIKYDSSLGKLAALEQKGVTVSAEKRDIIEQQTASLLEQIQIAEEANNDIYKLGMAAAQGFEDGFQTNLADLIKGKTSSFKDAILGTMVQAGEALADELASQMTARIMPGLMGLFGLKKKATPADTMAEAIRLSTTAADKRWKKTFLEAGEIYAKALKEGEEREFVKKSNNEVDTKAQVLSVNGNDVKQDNINKKFANDFQLAAQAKLDAETARLRDLPDGTAAKPFHSIIIKQAEVPFMGGQPGYDADGRLIPKVPGPEKVPPKVTENPNYQHNAPVKAGEKVTAVNTAVTGDNSAALNTQTKATDASSVVVASALGEGGTFQSTLKGFASSIGGMFASLVQSGGSTASQIFGMALSAGVSAYAGSLTGRNGGVFSEGKRAGGYATGGVAKGSTSGYTATLHGTEAVVPLPGGKAIPVDMKGNNGSVNNIVVNVSTDGSTNTEGSTGPDMDKMGSAIAKAVQVELQNQKRSGGILNPYGVA